MNVTYVWQLLDNGHPIPVLGLPWPTDLLWLQGSSAAYVLWTARQTRGCSTDTLPRMERCCVYCSCRRCCTHSFAKLLQSSWLTEVTVWWLNTRFEPDVSPVLGTSNSYPWTCPANCIVTCVADCLELDVLAVHCTTAGHKTGPQAGHTGGFG